MPLPEDVYAKQREAALRRMVRQKEKLADPAYRENALAKQRQRNERARTRQREKIADPAYREKLVERQKLKRAEKAMKTPPALKSNKASVKPRKASKGLLGRTPTADERRIMDLIGGLGCIACLIHGHATQNISLHHIAGRTTAEAHKKVLGLCDHHHQHAAPKDVRDLYPWLVPVHACGIVGGRAAFEKENGTQMELLKLTYETIGVDFPFS